MRALTLVLTGWLAIVEGGAPAAAAPTRTQPPAARAQPAAAPARAGAGRVRATAPRRAAPAPPRAAPAARLSRAVRARSAAAVDRAARSRRVAADDRPRRAAREPVGGAPSGQSIGTPWAGRLERAARLEQLEGTFVRRPHRAFGTHTTVAHVAAAIRAVRGAFPDAHVLAIGDLSTEAGGWISEHVSHRSGRDVDLGLFFHAQPAGYPERFARASAETLDRAATWALLASLVNTREADGGVELIFLDYELQGLLYEWALERGVPREHLAPVFQYPRGAAAPVGIVRHEPHHADHLHVRFRCAAADALCGP